MTGRQGVISDLIVIPLCSCQICTASVEMRPMKQKATGCTVASHRPCSKTTSSRLRCQNMESFRSVMLILSFVFRVCRPAESPRFYVTTPTSPSFTQILPLSICFQDIKHFVYRFKAKNIDKYVNEKTSDMLL